MEAGNKCGIPHIGHSLWFGAFNCWKTCSALATHLLPQCVVVPQGGKLELIFDGFETCAAFHRLAEAIAGAHIPMLCPDEGVSVYLN